MLLSSTARGSTAPGLAFIQENSYSDYYYYYRVVVGIHVKISHGNLDSHGYRGSLTIFENILWFISNSQHNFASKDCIVTEQENQKIVFIS